MRLMPLAPLFALAILGGCKREPDFAERYKDAGAKIGQSAQDIDAQIAGTGAPEEEEQP